MEYRIVNDTQLYHYGVPGMKWGVRKAYAKADRSYAKIDKFNQKIKNTKETGIVTQAINARRRGRVARITLKAENRKAKADYLKAKASGNKAAKDKAAVKLNDTRINRAKNAAQTYVGVSNFRRGNYNKHRAAGKSIVESAVFSGTVMNRVYSSPTAQAYSDRGKKAAEKAIAQSKTAYGNTKIAIDNKKK